MTGPRGPAVLSTEAAGHRDVQRHNLRLVLGVISRCGEVSRAGVAEATGLTKGTVSSLVDALMGLHLVVEGGTTESGRVGRPGRLLTLNGQGVVGIGLEVNVDYIAVCVLDLLGVARYRQVVRVDNRDLTPEEGMDALVALGSQALDWVADTAMVAGGVTVGVPGLVEIESGTLLHAPNLGWKHLPIAQMVTSRLGHPELPVHVENEANLGALGELWEGRGCEWGDFVHISGEIGVGAGLIFGGSLWRGSGGTAGEIGHMQIDRNGPDCPCGSRGCLERFVGQEALLRAAGLQSAVATTLGTSSGGSVTTLVSSARAGDATTLDTLADAGRILGGACATVANLLNPATIVLGGIYEPLAPWILGPLTEELGRARDMRQLRVMVSELGMDAAVRGAASWPLHRILSNPLLMSNGLARSSPL